MGYLYENVPGQSKGYQMAQPDEKGQVFALVFQPAWAWASDS